MELVLIVEDNVKISSALRDFLERAGYSTHTFSDGLPVVDWVRAQQPSLVLLDLTLPGMDGMDICREIRAFSSIPIIIVTARVEEIDRLLGLELGADDYVCKPFSPREVVARVKANLRRVTYEDDSPSAVASFYLDEQRHHAELDGQLLELTPVELRMLSALNNPAGRVWSRNQLLDKMYNDHRSVSDRTVDTHIANLRRKLQAVRPKSSCIHSVYGVGYKLEL